MFFSFHGLGTIRHAEKKEKIITGEKTEKVGKKNGDNRFVNGLKCVKIFLGYKRPHRTHLCTVV